MVTPLTKSRLVTAATSAVMAAAETTTPENSQSKILLAWCITINLTSSNPLVDSPSILYQCSLLVVAKLHRLNWSMESLSIKYNNISRTICPT